ncbi:MAG: hypothetical protein PHI19_06690 [Clostridia bacterium]|nr:hypothetical protein [Clostridia bacterium]
MAVEAGLEVADLLAAAAEEDKLSVLNNHIRGVFYCRTPFQ